MKIGNKIVGLKNPCVVVAEISANHKGDLYRMLKLIRIAKKSGADLIKIQSYTPKSITINSKRKDFKISNPDSPWKNKTLWDIYKDGQTPKEWHKKIFEYSKKIGINVFSSPFDESAVDLLEKLKCPAYKIASAEINHIPLLEKIARTGKPVIISVGLAQEKEIKDAIKIFKKFGNNKIIVLQCVSAYPAPLNEQNVRKILSIKKKFGVEVGLSDHSTNSLSSIVAVSLGACMIEKHFNLSDKKKTLDSFFSTDEKSFKKMVEEIRLTESILGDGKIKISKSSLKNIKSKRSIYISNKIKKGEKITKNNIKVIRPSYGLHPKYYNFLLGKRVNKNLFAGDRFLLKYISKK